MQKLKCSSRVISSWISHDLTIIKAISLVRKSHVIFHMLFHLLRILFITTNYANHVISHKHRDSSRKAREWRKSCTCQLSPRDLSFLYILHVEDELVYKGQSSERWCTARPRPKDGIQPDQDMVCRLTQTLKWCTDWYTAWPRCSLQTDPEPEMVHRLV